MRANNVLGRPRSVENCRAVHKERCASEIAYGHRETRNGEAHVGSQALEGAPRGEAKRPSRFVAILPPLRCDGRRNNEGWVGVIPNMSLSVSLSRMRRP